MQLLNTWQSINLIVINNAFDYAHDDKTCQTLHGDNLLELVQSVYPKGLPLNTYLYHDKWEMANDVTPKTDKEIDKLNTLSGVFYLVTYPSAGLALTAAIWTVAIPAIMSFLMPSVDAGGMGSQPPSPNNALAQRTNRQRLGGRVPDIFGEIWALPDLIAPSYSVFIDNTEVEFSYLALGFGCYHVAKAYDDTTPINQIRGATALVFNPNKTINDTPDFRFGSNFTADEASYAGLAVKRYTSVNGQVLNPPDDYLTAEISFSSPNVLTTTKDGINFATMFKVGDNLLIENANDLASGNNLTIGQYVGNRQLIIKSRLTSGWINDDGSINGLTSNDCHDPNFYSTTGNTNFVFTLYENGQNHGGIGRIVFYDSNKNVIGASDTHYANQFTSVYVTAPPNTAYYRNSFISKALKAKLEIGTQPTPYSLAPEDIQDFGKAIKYNLNGTYKIASVSEKQIVLSDVVAIASDWQKITDNQDFTVKKSLTISSENINLWQGWFYTDLTNHSDVMINIKAPNGIYTSYGDEWSALRIWFDIESEIVDNQGNAVSGTYAKKSFYLQSPSYDKYLDGQGRAWVRSTDDDVRRSAYRTVKISNPSFKTGKRLRWRIRRTTRKVNSNKGQVLQDVKLSDFYGIKPITASDTPKGVTTVYTKTLATEGALSVKERKLKILVQRYVKDWQNNDNLILSNRIDDIIYHIATDSKIGGMQTNQLNMAQIKAEIDSQIAYFGTTKTAEFCGTFDTNNITTEEMIQTVAQAGLCQSYRLNNQIHLHFERRQDFSLVQFNAHNILPDSYEYSESFGARNDYDGVQVTYTDPSDDAKVTLSYPTGTVNPQKLDLNGVRNKVQAYIHMMRTHYKNQLAYKTCEFIGADESGIVIPTNRIDVADLLASDTQSGTVESLEMINGKMVLMVSEPINYLIDTPCTIFVQTVGGVVDNIKCVVKSAYELTLNRPPNQLLSLDVMSVVRATYKLVNHSEYDRDSYIVTAKDTGGNPLSHKLTCINYTDKYYQNDDDFKKGLINLN